MLPSRRDAYANKIINAFGANVIQYLPLWETASMYADDYSAAENNALIWSSGVTQGADGIGDGRTSMQMDGTTGFVNIHSAGFEGDFDEHEGTAAIWIKADAGIWTDTIARRILNLYSSATKYFSIIKGGDNNALYFQVNTGTQKYFKVTTSSTAWMHCAITWSASNNRLKFFLNGSQVGLTYTDCLGTFVTPIAVNYTNIGIAKYDGGLYTDPWKGCLAH